MMKFYLGLSTRHSPSLCSTNERIRRNADTSRQVSILIGLPDLHPKGSLGKAHESSFFKVSHAMKRIAKMIQYLYDLMPTSLPEFEILSTRKNKDTGFNLKIQFSQETFSPSKCFLKVDKPEKIVP